MSKMQGEATIRHVSMRQLQAHVPIVDPFTSLPPEVTESGMPLVVKLGESSDEAGLQYHRDG